MRLTVGRDGETRVVKVRLVDERRFFNNEILWKRIGLRVRAASPGGFVVDTIEPGGPAARADIRKGMLISSVDGARVDSVVQLARTAHAKAPGEKVTLNLVWGERRGPVVYRSEGAAEVLVR